MVFGGWFCSGGRRQRRSPWRSRGPRCFLCVKKALLAPARIKDRLQFARDAHDEEAADKKAVELLQNSPYKDKLGAAGLFLRALEERSKELPALITPQFGSRMAKGDSVLRMSALLQSAPALQITDLSQVAALPLGSRIKLDPWDDHVELNKSKPMRLQLARDKMAFEVTPMFPHLARYREAAMANAAGNGK